MQNSCMIDWHWSAMCSELEVSVRRRGLWILESWSRRSSQGRRDNDRTKTPVSSVALQQMYWLKLCPFFNLTVSVCQKSVHSAGKCPALDFTRLTPRRRLDGVLIWSLGSPSKLIQGVSRTQLPCGRSSEVPNFLWLLPKSCFQLLEAFCHSLPNDLSQPWVCSFTASWAISRAFLNLSVFRKGPVLFKDLSDQVRPTADNLPFDYFSLLISNWITGATLYCIHMCSLHSMGEGSTGIS